jgi:Protein of unknown function (DUF5818)
MAKGEDRMNTKFIRSSLLGMMLATASTGVLLAQDAQVPQSELPQPRTEQENTRQPQQKAFAGVIVKEGQRLALQDPTSKVSYKVDDDSKVRDYLGKHVKIIGNLDASNILHVESIELVS